MQVVQLVVSVVVIMLGGGLWWVSWGISGIVFALVCVVMTMGTPTARGVLASLRAWRRRRRGGGGGGGAASAEVV